MKVITANRLQDGAVIYLSPDDTWTDEFAGAALFADAEASDALAAAGARMREITEAYLAEVDASGPRGRETLRETIRSAGPTVRPDLGKQAESA